MPQYIVRIAYRLDRLDDDSRIEKERRIAQARRVGRTIHCGMHVYSDPARQSDRFACPDVETFFIDEGDDDFKNEDGDPLPKGWYWWTCFPGCLPDSDPFGPFDTEDEAIADAQEV